METALFIIVALVILWVAAGWWLRGPDLSKFDQPSGRRGTKLDRVSSQSRQVLELLDQMQKDIDSVSLANRLTKARRVIDQGIPGAPQHTGELRVEIVETHAGDVPAEWVVAPNADPGQRLLYIHGGGFAVGSPRSHRTITSSLSQLAGVSVLAIDYRLLPEHRRLAGILDCQNAYRWMLENGPNEQSPATKLFVGGDSAGGSLTLMLIAWIRDQELPQVNAAIALSPNTDSTCPPGTLQNHVATDPMLGPVLGRLARLPRTLVLLIVLMSSRMRPTNPLISPIHGNLSDLPPTLVHASEAEMLLDDGRRWVNKARAQGTDAQLMTWPEMVHVWQIFAHVLPEANESLEIFAEFIRKNAIS